MKTMILLAVMVLSSCAILKEPGSLPEDELFQTRKFAGVFMEYRYTAPERFGDPHMIWIKTNREEVFGIISAYSKECEFEFGEWLYIRRIYYSPGGISGYWIYQIEGQDSGKFYRLSEFQYDNKILVQTWF